MRCCSRSIAMSPSIAAKTRASRSGGLKLRIGLEVEQNLTSLRARNRPDEGVGQHLQKLSGLLVIMLAALALLRLRVGVIHEGAHLLALLRFSGERLPIRARPRDRDLPDRACATHCFTVLPGLPVNFEIKPVRVVIAACGEFSLNGLLDKRFAGSLSEADRDDAARRVCEREKPSPEHGGPPVEHGPTMTWMRTSAGSGFRLTSPLKRLSSACNR